MTNLPHAAPARLLGALTLVLTAATLLMRARPGARLAGAPALPALPASPILDSTPGRAPSAAHPPSLPAALHGAPARGLHGAAALLAASVLADSAVEHARADFANPGMLTPLFSSLAAIAAGAHGARSAGELTDGAYASTRGRGVAGEPTGGARAAYLTALFAGAAGTAFHLYNLLARPGGLRWQNLFYGAPLGAPAALSLAGLFGLGALRVQAARDRPPRAGRALCALSAAGLLGSSSEAALLHFRGAYHNRFMWLPVTIPPVAALMLAASAAFPARAPRRAARRWSALTALLGLGGIGFHVFGVQRQMGGWRNWRQNVPSGPPLSAPPAFTALGLGGLCALALLDRGAAP